MCLCVCAVSRFTASLKGCLTAEKCSYSLNANKHIKNGKAASLTLTFAKKKQVLTIEHCQT